MAFRGRAGRHGNTSPQLIGLKQSKLFYYRYWKLMWPGMPYIFFPFTKQNKSLTSQKATNFKDPSTVGPRVLQNIFQFCVFLVSGASFEHVQLPQFFQHVKKVLKKAKNNQESLGFEPLINFYSFQHSKNTIFKVNLEPEYAGILG